MNQEPVLKIDASMLKGPISTRVSAANILQSPMVSGLRINPGELMKTEPFNNLARQVETLTAVVQVLAVKLGMTQDEIDKMMADAMRGVRVAEELMEK